MPVTVETGPIVAHSFDACAACDGMAQIVNEPLTRDEHWQAVAAGRSRVFVGGDSVWQPVRGGALDILAV